MDVQPFRQSINGPEGWDLGAMLDPPDGPTTRPWQQILLGDTAGIAKLLQGTAEVDFRRNFLLG